MRTPRTVHKELVAVNEVAVAVNPDLSPNKTEIIIAIRDYLRASIVRVCERDITRLFAMAKVPLHDVNCLPTFKTFVELLLGWILTCEKVRQKTLVVFWCFFEAEVKEFRFDSF